MSSSIQEIQHCIDYVIDITKANEVKVTVGLFKDYTLKLTEYNLASNYHLMNVMKEVVFE